MNAETRKEVPTLPWKDGPVFQKEGRAIFWTDTSKPGKWQRRVDQLGVFSAEDAAFIVRACNSYDDLVAALNAVRMDAVSVGGRENVISDATREKVKAALTKSFSA